MPRVDLQVSFSEKDAVKRLGARWDGARKVWYVPDGVDASAFTQWLPSEAILGIRASSYFIAKTTTGCWKCGDDTSVVGFVLPAGFEMLEPDEDDDESHAWYRHSEPTIVHYVADLLPAVAARIGMRSRHYRKDFSKTTQSSYWMNHCEHCGMKQGDFAMYCEPAGAFFPMDARAASRITLHAFAEPFACNGSTMHGDLFVECMRRG